MDKPTVNFEKPIEKLEKPTEQLEKPTEQLEKPTEKMEKLNVNLKPHASAKKMKPEGKKLVQVAAPVYDNELSIYRKTTLDQIKEFRKARSNWLSAAEENLKIYTDSTEGLKDSHLYTGRCAWIRKLGRKNSLLREHYHGLRPLKYWTLKRKLIEFDEEDRFRELLADLKAEREKKEKFQDPCEELSLWTREDMEECKRQAARLKGRKEQKLKNKECKEKRARGPCKKALKRLKESKLSEGLLESCKCDAGREVTVVIKGFCLCDQTGLNKINLSRVCQEYHKTTADKEVVESKDLPPKHEIASKMGKAEMSLHEPSENQGPSPEKYAPPSENKKEDTVKEVTKEVTVRKNKALHSDSLMLLKKKMNTMDMGEERESKERDKKKEVEEKEATEAEPETEYIGKRKVMFKEEGNLKGDQGVRRDTQVNVTMFEKHSEFADPGPSETTKQEGPMQAVHEAPQESKLPADISDSLRTLIETKKYASPKLDTDSMNNFLSSKNGEGIKVNFKKISDKKEADDNKYGTKNGAKNEAKDEEKNGAKNGTKNGTPKKKLSNLGLATLSHLSSSLEIHKKRIRSTHISVEQKSSSVLNTLTKEEKDTKRKIEKGTTKVKVNPIPNVISIDENSAPSPKIAEFEVKTNIQTTPQKTISENLREEHSVSEGEIKEKESLAETGVVFEKSEEAVGKTGAEKAAMKAREIEPSSSDVWIEVKKSETPPEEVEEEKEEPEESETVIKPEDDPDRPAAERAAIKGCTKCHKGSAESGGLWIELKDAPKEEETKESEGPPINGDNTSMITLYKNKSPEGSEMGLTNEELVKMKMKSP